MVQAVQPAPQVVAPMALALRTIVALALRPVGLRRIGWRAPRRGDLLCATGRMTATQAARQNWTAHDELTISGQEHRTAHQSGCRLRARSQEHRGCQKALQADSGQQGVCRSLPECPGRWGLSSTRPPTWQRGAACED